MLLSHRTYTAQRYSQSHVRGLDFEEHVPTPGAYRPPPVPLLKVMTIAYALQSGWSLGGIDRGVQENFLELFYRAGRLYIRVL